MAITIPTAAPLVVRYMQRLEWTRTLTDYAAADGWTVSANLTGPAPGDGFDIAGSDAGSGAYTFLEETADKALGVYRWQVWATHSSDGRHLVESGALTIHAGYLEGATDRDSSTHFSRMLALIEARLEGRLDLDAETYSISGRSLARIPMVDLEKMRDRYQIRRRKEIREQEAGVRSGVRRRIAVAF